MEIPLTSLVIVGLMLLHPRGRQLVWWLLFVLPMAIVMLMIASEPDLD